MPLALPLRCLWLVGRFNLEHKEKYKYPWRWIVGLVGNGICCYCIGLKFGSRYSCEIAHGGITVFWSLWEPSPTCGRHTDKHAYTRTCTCAVCACTCAYTHKKWVHLNHIIQLTINKAGILYALLTHISISQVLSYSKKSINISFKFWNRNLTKVLSISEGQNERQNCSPS